MTDLRQIAENWAMVFHNQKVNFIVMTSFLTKTLFRPNYFRSNIHLYSPSRHHELFGWSWAWGHELQLIVTAPCDQAMTNCIHCIIHIVCKSYKPGQIWILTVVVQGGIQAHGCNSSCLNVVCYISAFLATWACTTLAPYASMSAVWLWLMKGDRHRIEHGDCTINIPWMNQRSSLCLPVHLLSTSLVS